MKNLVGFIDPGNKSRSVIGQRDSVSVVNKLFKQPFKCSRMCVWYKTAGWRLKSLIFSCLWINFFLVKT